MNKGENNLDERKINVDEVKDAPPQCMISLVPEIEELAMMNYLRNGGPRFIRGYVNRVIIPEWVRLMKAAEVVHGENPDAEMVISGIIDDWNVSKAMPV